MKAIAQAVISQRQLVRIRMKAFLLSVFGIFFCVGINAAPQMVFLSPGALNIPVYIKYHSSNNTNYHGKYDEEKDGKYRPDATTEFVSTGTGKIAMRSLRENMAKDSKRPKELVYIAEDGKWAFYPKGGKLYVSNSPEWVEEPFFGVYLTNILDGMDFESWPNMSMIFENEYVLKNIKTIDISADTQTLEIRGPILKDSLGERYNVMTIQLMRIDAVPYPLEISFNDVYLNADKKEFPAPAKLVMTYGDYEKLKRSPLCIPKRIESVSYDVTPALGNSGDITFSREFEHRENVKVLEISEDPKLIEEKSRFELPEGTEIYDFSTGASFEVDKSLEKLKESMKSK